MNAQPSEYTPMSRRSVRGPKTPTLSISDLRPSRIDYESVDPNPQFGCFPLEHVQIGRTERNELGVQAFVKEQFIQEYVLPRGRPHFAGLHGMILNDALAVIVHHEWRDEPYGSLYRIIETDAHFQFFRERFIRGSIRSGAKVPAEVDRWSVRLAVKSDGEVGQSSKFGKVVIEYLGHDRDDVVLLARSVVHYLRRKAVIRISGE